MYGCVVSQMQGRVSQVEGGEDKISIERDIKKVFHITNY